jgi:small GTP-binding protein
MDERSLHIVIVGHVDHGKSTLVGRLFHDTGSLPAEKMNEIRRACEELGKPFEFAYIMDNFEEERKKGITIDIAHTFFATQKRRYVIIDAPGHKEFLKNMVSGTSQAEAALLLVDISQGIQEQTLRHCFVLSLLGVRQIAVIVNKMDLVGYSKERFDAVSRDAVSALARFNLSPAYIIPISASAGENVAVKSSLSSWYAGPTVLEALDSFEPLKVEEKGLRFPVQDVYEVSGKPVPVGRVEAGRLKPGQEVVIYPANTKTRITSVMKFMEEGMTEAGTGECVGITAEASLKRGDILADTEPAFITSSVRANIFWMVDQDYRLGLPMVFKCATQEAKGRIDKIYKRFDPATEKTEDDLTVIKPAEVAEVEITLDGMVAIDSFSEIPELGRFVLEHAGTPVAGGIII